MTKEHFETLKEEYIGHITEYIKQAGGLFPHISIFAEEKIKQNLINRLLFMYLYQMSLWNLKMVKMNL